MLQRTLFYLILFFYARAGGGQPLAVPDTTAGYEINIQLQPYKNLTVILAHYYGSELRIDASAILNEKSEAVFKGNFKLHPGIYVIYDEHRESMVDFLVGEDQHFSIQAVIGLNDQTIRFSESEDNSVLNRYKQFMAFREFEIDQYQSALASAVKPEDSAQLLQQLKAIDDTVQQFREDLIQRYPGSLLSSLLAALREPVLPVPLRNPATRKDSLAARQYRKDHFWDGVLFSDSRLLYTPFFESKLERYYADILERQPDSVITKIDWMMSWALANEAMTEFVLRKLFFGSLQYQFKWEDAVFIHLFEKYITNRNYSWLPPEERKMLTEHAYTLMANKKGTKAREISLPGMDGKNISLLNSTSTYTLLCFWDVTCAHCRETLPVLDSLLHTAWKNKGIKIYAVSLESEGNQNDWQHYIKENKLGDWTHVYYAKETAGSKTADALQPYNIWYFPSFYLLDKEHRLVAEKMKYPAIADFINSLFKVGK